MNHTDVLPASLQVLDLDEPHGMAAPLGPEVPLVGVGVTDLAVAPQDHALRAGCDVVLPRHAPELDAIAATVAQHPIASGALVRLLRGAARRSVEEGLVAESLTYSALQAGPEFAAWLATRTRKERGPEGPPIRLERDGSTLRITLTRPHVRNALDTAMRDALAEAFELVAADAAITEVHLAGEGASYSSGGDLDEFGTFPDPETAHEIRLERSLGRAVHEVRDRVVAHLHGACSGSGIELPAFAGRVVADAGTTLALPELALGLVPGAGGTVSLPRRIGRWRTALLGLTGQPVDAPSALEWGLVDELVG